MTLNVYMTFENGITPARGFESQGVWETVLLPYGITPARGFESWMIRISRDNPSPYYPREGV